MAREMGKRAPLRLDTWRKRRWALTQLLEAQQCAIQLKCMDEEEMQAQPDANAMIAPNARLTLQWTNEGILLTHAPRWTIVRLMVNKMPGWTDQRYDFRHAPTIEEFETRIWPGLRVALSTAFQAEWWFRKVLREYPQAELKSVYNNYFGDEANDLLISIEDLQIDYSQDNNGYFAIYACWPQGLLREHYEALQQFVLRADVDVMNHSKLIRTIRWHHAITVNMQCGEEDIERGLRLIRLMREALHRLGDVGISA